MDDADALTPPAAPEPAPSAARHWQRTSPLAIIFFLFRLARRIVTDGLPALAPLAALAATSDEFPTGLAITAAAIVLPLAVAWAVASYLRFRYHTEDGRLILRQGVIHREQLNLDFDRVQNVAIREPFYMRPFGLAVVALDSAGSAGKEVTLGGIKRQAALDLRDAISKTRKARQKSDDSVVKEASTESAETQLIARTPADLAIYGLTAANVIWIAVLVGIIFSNTESAWSDWIQSKLAVLFFVGVDGPSVWNVVAGIIGLAILLPMVSILGAWFRHFGFRLTQEGDIFRRYGGLLNRHEESLPKQKIQALVWHQNAIARIFRRINFKAKVTSAGEAGVDSSGLPKTSSTFVVPSLREPEANSLAAQMLDGADVSDTRFSRVHYGRYVRRYLLLGWFLPLTGVSVGPGLAVNAWLFLIFPAGMLIATGLLTMTWRRLGYAVRGEHGLVREGFVGSSVTVFPLFKVQRVDIRTSPSMRRKGLVHLSIHLASNSLTLPCVRQEDAYRLRDLALYHAESNRAAWF